MINLKSVPHTNKIVNSNNQIVFKYPANTLLDNITNDLWGIVVEYYYHHLPFACGDEKTQSTDYRLMTQKECESVGFRKLFSDYYFGAEGIYSLEKSEHIKYNFSFYVVRAGKLVCIVEGLHAFHNGTKKDELLPFEINVTKNYIYNMKFDNERPKIKQFGIDNWFLFIKKRIYLY